ncbi:MAG: thioredoxin family protein [Rickettsiales bacterium]|nr:thioredoxin family protein [Rickettsiales bacterium]
MRFFVLIFFLFFNINISFANNSYDENAKVSLKFAKYSDEEILFAIEFKLAPGWKIYDNKQYSLGFPTEISLAESENLREIKVFFPRAKRFLEYDQYETFGYENQVLIPLTTKAINSNELIKGKLKISYALCNNICIAKEDYLGFLFEPKEFNKENYDVIKKSLKSFEETILYNVWLYLIAGVIAGFILNFMPCILPVLFLKIYNLLDGTRNNLIKTRKTAFASILGIFFAFFIFSLIVIILQFLGKNIGWGLHFQQPLFVVFLMVIIAVFAASIFNYIIIDIPTNLKDKLNKIKINNHDFLKDFFSAILAAILATPCSAPFLGTAMVFAFAGSYINSFMIFMAIAFGFSLPYFALLIYPKILKLLPKPGKWMDKLKNIMGVFLILTVIWLAYVLLAQIGFLAVAIILLQIFVIFKFFKFKNSFIKFFSKKIYYFLIISNIIIMFLIIPFSYKNHQDLVEKSDVWINYFDVDIQAELAENNVVFVNVTADWCITCKFNEFRVLARSDIINIFANKNFIAVRADYTKQNEKIRIFLESVGRYAVPTYIIFSKKHPQGKILSEVLSVEYLQNELLDEIN